MRKIKGALSVILSLVLVLGAVVPVFAAPKKCDCGHTPVVSVSGINHVPLVDGNGKQVFAPSTEDIVSAILKLVPSLTKFLALSNTSNETIKKDAAIDLIYDVVREVEPIFEPIKCDENGNSVDPEVGINRYFPESIDKYNYEVRKAGSVDRLSKTLGDMIGGSHVFLFTYDWRIDLEKLADMLNDYIISVKKQTGHDKVVIDGQSMGACLVQAYLAKYGTKDVETVAMLSGAYMGVDMVGELCKGKIDLSDTALVDLLIQKISGNADEKSKEAVLKEENLIKSVMESLDPILKDEAVKRIAYDELLVPYFGFMPSLWAFIPSEDFDEAWNYMFKKHKPSEELKDKIMFYRNNVQLTMEERIKSIAEDKNVKYYCISHYNRQMLPLTPDCHLNADGIIEANRTSGGAIFADRGKTLPQDYVQKINDGKNRISPDRVVDGSTCLVPSYTWFIRSLNHVEYNTASSPFFAWLLTSKEQYNVESNPLYTQFMRYDYNVGYLSPSLYEYGDASLDGTLDLVDARIALRLSQNMETEPENWQVNLTRADEDGNGTVSTEEVQNIFNKCVA